MDQNSRKANSASAPVRVICTPSPINPATNPQRSQSGVAHNKAQNSANRAAKALPWTADKTHQDMAQRSDQIECQRHDEDPRQHGRPHQHIQILSGFMGDTRQSGKLSGKDQKAAPHQNGQGLVLTRAQIKPAPKHRAGCAVASDHIINHRHRIWPWSAAMAGKPRIQPVIDFSRDSVILNLFDRIGQKTPAPEDRWRYGPERRASADRTMPLRRSRRRSSRANRSRRQHRSQAPVWPGNWRLRPTEAIATFDTHRFFCASGFTRILP